MSLAKKRPSLTVFAMIAATLFSKFFGMVRGMIMAWTLADSLSAVAFTAAYRIPGAIFDFLLSAAILGCFIPAYGKARAESEKTARVFSASFLCAVTVIAALLSLAGIIFAPAVISVSSPGISPEAAAVASSLLRIMFPMMIFAALAYTLTGILQSERNFILPALISSVSNIFIITYLVIAGADFNVYTLSFVYVISWFIQFLTLCIPLAVTGKFPISRPDMSDKYLRLSLKNAPNIMASSWFGPASILIAAFFSSFVSDTAFVTYDYSIGIYTIIAGVTVYGVGNYVFPSLSALCAEGKTAEFQLAVKKSLFAMLLIAIPIFSASFTLSYEGTALLYLRGSFSEELALACARSLSILSIAMPAYAVSEILYRAFFAAGKVGIPARAACIAIAVGIVSNALLLLFGCGRDSVSISYTIAQWTHTAVLFAYSVKHFSPVSEKKDIVSFIKLGLCALFSILSTSFLAHIVPVFTSFGQTISLLFKITIVFILAFMIYLLCIYLMGFLPRSQRKEVKNIDEKSA